MSSRAHHLTLLLLFSGVFVLYHLSPEPQIHKSSYRKESFQKVVAYSLERSMQDQGRRVICQNALKIPEEIVVSGNWQKVTEDVFVYGAYFDERLKPHVFIRAVAMIKGHQNATIYCHTNLLGAIHVVEATLTTMWLKEWDPGSDKVYEPYLISCKIPHGERPSDVAFAAVACEPAHARFSIPDPTRDEVSNKITVCVKQMNFEKDISHHLITWLELNRILGADKFDIYVTVLHKRTLEMLKWYESFGNVTLRTFNSLTGDNKDVWQRRRNEIIVYNDCLYRNLDYSEYILPIDIDEIVIPRFYATWQQMLSHFFHEKPNLRDDFSSFSVKNAYYFAKDREFTASFFKSLIRSEYSPDGESGKSFVSTDSTLVVFNHYALTTLRPGVRRTYFMPSSIAQMNHYKRWCSARLLPQCLRYLSSPVRIFDPVINRYKKQLFLNVKAVMKTIA